MVLLLGTLAILAAPPRRTLGGTLSVQTTSTESLSFSLYSTVAGSQGSPVFNSNGLLTSTGSALFPALNAVSGNTQSYSLPTGQGAYTQVIAANQTNPLPNSSFLTPLPASFGTAAIAAQAAVSLPNDGTDVNQKTGISFNSGSYLQSAAIMTPNTAAVSFTHLHSDFLASGTAFKAIPGMLINANATLSQTAGSFVVLGEEGTIVIRNSSHQVVATDSFTGISALGYNGGTVSTMNTGTAMMGETPTAPGIYNIQGYQTFGSVTLSANMTVSIDAYLTLISDPGSRIQLGASSGLSGPPPTIGVYTGGVLVPEPASFLEMAMGILVLGGCLGIRQWHRLSGRPRRTHQNRRTRESRSAS